MRAQCVKRELKQSISPDLSPPPGKRQDHRAKERPGGGQLKGWRFFADDEDEFGLEDILQASGGWSSMLP